MLEEKMSLEEKAKNLVIFARNSNANELDNVVEAIVNFAREEVKNLLKEIKRIKALRGENETIVSERQGPKTTELFKR